MFAPSRIVPFDEDHSTDVVAVAVNADSNIAAGKSLLFSTLSYRHMNFASSSSTESTSQIVEATFVNVEGAPQLTAEVEVAQIRHPPVLEPTYDPTLNPNHLSRKVELFENFRYTPRLGFSAKGLLVMDRGVISNDDGTMW